MPKGIKDDEGHYDQANQIEDSIHALARKFDSALPLVQPTERPHEQEKRNGDTQEPQQSCTSHFSLLFLAVS
jgi:hypothetical protein